MTAVSAWNVTHNLTAARSALEAIEIFLADGLVLAQRLTWKTDSHVLDLGSGGGAPAFAWMIAKPDLRFTLVERQHKKVAFLRQVVGILSLADRANVLRLDYVADATALPHVDVAASRATFSPTDWLRMGQKLAARTVCFLTSEDVAQSGAETTVSYTLPWSQAKRRIAVFDNTVFNKAIFSKADQPL